MLAGGELILGMYGERDGVAYGGVVHSSDEGKAWTEMIKMDISTISRVVNGKYVQTEFGVYELKHFFSEGLSTDSGEEVSNKEVKALIERIISEEDKKKPLSDQRIANMLEEKGFQIARRTVTKYREQQGIPVARLRKEIVLS